MIASIESAATGPAGLLVAFGIGMVSFFSPCVLPLVPGYLSYMSGVGGQDLESGAKRGQVLVASLLFVAGFAIVFTLLGAGASALGGVLLDNIVGFRRFAGVIVIVMGLIFLSTLAVKPLMRGKESANGFISGASGAGLKVASLLSTERRMSTRRVNAGVAGALPLGAAFAVGWTPCVGPGLGVILSLAAQEGNVGKGAFLLFFFSMGFGVWFVLGGLAFQKAIRAFGVIRRHMRGFVAVGGLLMVTIGILMVTDTWNELLAPIRRWVNNFAPPI